MTRGAGLGLVLALGVAPAASEAQPTGTPAATATPRRNTCLVRRVTFDAGALPGMTHGQPAAVVPWEGGALVAWLDPAGALRGRMLDGEGAPIGDVRVLATGVLQFAATRTATGFALAWLEATRDLVLARVNLRLEGQNVPRVVRTFGAGEPVTGIQIATVRDGMVMVWSRPAERAVMALATDGRGVPRGGPAPVTEGLSPRLVRLGESDTTVLLVEPGGGGTGVHTLGPDLSLGMRLRWPAGAVGPVELHGSVYTVQPMVTGQLLLMRVPAGGGIPATMPDLSQAPGLRPLWAHGAAGVVLARARDTRTARESLVRLFSDGSSSVVTPFRGWSDDEPVWLGPDGVAWALQREGPTHGAPRPGVLRVQCPR